MSRASVVAFVVVTSPPVRKRNLNLEKKLSLSHSNEEILNTKKERQKIPKSRDDEVVVGRSFVCWIFCIYIVVAGCFV